MSSGLAVQPGMHRKMLISTEMAIKLDGINDAINLGRPVYNTSALTYGGWVRPEELTVKAIWSNRAFNIGVFLYTQSSGQWRVHIRDSSSLKSLDSSTVFIPGNWYHIVVTAVSSGFMRIYINGNVDPISVALASGALQPNSSADTAIGFDGSTPYPQAAFRDWRIYGSALSASNITAWYLGNPPAGASHAWTFNGITDLSPTVGAISATLIGNPTSVPFIL